MSARYRGRGSGSRRAEALRVEGGIARSLRRWSDLRTRMLAAGLRPTWIDRAEFDARVVPDAVRPAKG